MRLQILRRVHNAPKVPLRSVKMGSGVRREPKKDEKKRVTEAPKVPSQETITVKALILFGVLLSGFTVVTYGPMFYHVYVIGDQPEPTAVPLGQMLQMEREKRQVQIHRDKQEKIKEESSVNETEKDQKSSWAKFFRFK